MIRCSLSHVQLEHFTVRRGRDVLVEDVSLSLCCGQLTALIGSNGAGKTTALEIIENLRRCEADGCIRWWRTK